MGPIKLVRVSMRYCLSAEFSSAKMDPSAKRWPVFWVSAPPCTLYFSLISLYN